MARIKPKRKSTEIDMTPFVDVAFLLLTFFILVAQFKPEEAVPIIVPSSTATEKIPEGNKIEISMDKDGRVFFGMAGQDNRIKMLENVAEMRDMSFTAAEKKKFSLLHNFGTPLNQLKGFLALKGPQIESYIEKTEGIPVDSADNQLVMWLKAAKNVKRKAPVIINGDKNAKYPVFNKIVQALQEVNQNQFQLETAGESAGSEG